MPVVQHAVELPDGTPASLSGVHIDIVTGDIVPMVYRVTDKASVAARLDIAPSGNTWSVNLPRQNELKPDNSVYRVTEDVRGSSSLMWYFAVPATGAGPFQLTDILTTAPNGLPPAIVVGGADLSAYVTTVAMGTAIGAAFTSHTQAADPHGDRAYAAAQVAALPSVARSGVYGDLTGRPTIPTTYSQLTGTVPQSALPALAMVDYLGLVASQAAMLALTGQRGDWCVRTDLGTEWQLIADDSTALASWRERVYPASPVQSVNGRKGPVTGLAEAADLTAHTSRTDNPHATTKAQVGLGNVDNTSDAQKVIAPSQLSATGTPSAATVLRGDGAWAAPVDAGARSVRRPFPVPAIGDWVIQPCTNLDANVGTNGEARFGYMYLPAGTYDAVTFHVNSGGSAGAVAKVIAYADAAGRLGTVALDTATVPVTNNAPTTITGLSLVVPAGGASYWAGVCVQGAPATMPTFWRVSRSGDTTVVSSSPTLMYANISPCWIVTGITGAAPANPTPGTGDGHVRLAFRRSA